MAGASGADASAGRPGTGVACYFLNLDRSTDRLAAATAALRASGLDPVRIPGIDGRDLTDAQRQLADPRVSRRLTGRALSPGEIGCYLGHLGALRRMVRGGAAHALICEDDVRPDPALGALCRALAGRGGAWSVAILANPARRLFTLDGDIEVEGRRFAVQRAHYPPMNAWANLWTRDGAERMLRDFARPLEPWDHAVRRFAQRTDGALSVDPAPVAAPAAASEIDRRGSRGARGPLYRWRKWRRLAQQRRQAQAYMRAAAH